MDAIYVRQDDGKSGGCCQRVSTEIRLAPFGVSDANGKTLSLQRSFAPSPSWLVIFAKTFLTGWSLEVLIRGLILYNDDTRYFFGAYLTNISLIVAILYLISSWITSVFFNSPDQSSGSPSIWIKTVWALFATGCTLQGMVTLLYWLLEYNPDQDTIDYFNVMKHGGVAGLLLFEGFVINRVPLRLRHFVFPLVVAALYIVWTVIHAGLGIGNPNREDKEGEEDPEDDDAIYATISWINRPQEAATTVSLALFVLAPILFGLLYLGSLPFRRYVETAAAGSARTPAKRSPQV